MIEVVEKPGPDTIVEAWTQVEIDRLEGDRAEALAADLRTAVELVHRVVADFTAMRDRMLGLVDIDPLLRWLADGQFVFLGAATYDTRPTWRYDPARRSGSSTSRARSTPGCASMPAVSIARSVGRIDPPRPA